MPGKIDLATIAIINNSIRQILMRSDKVYLIALNAMFVSRKATDGTPGFTTVTTQLRQFSGELNRQMHELKNNCSELVLQMSLLAKLQRTIRYTGKIHHLSGTETMRNRNNGLLQQLSGEVDLRIRTLSACLNRVLAMITIGQNLAVLAKVEASCATSIQKNLADIADKMDQTINEIEHIVDHNRALLAA